MSCPLKGWTCSEQTAYRIYWIGPILGSLLASAFYMFIKALEYETVNPDQDGTGEEVRHFDPQNRKVVPGPVDDVDEFSQSPPNKANKNGQVSAGNVNQRVGTLTGTDLMNDGRTAHDNTTEMHTYHTGPSMENGMGSDRTLHSSSSPQM